MVLDFQNLLIVFDTFKSRTFTQTMETSSTEILNPNTPKDVESGQNKESIQSDTLLNGESTGHFVLSQDIEFLLYGNTETQVSEGGEADLHIHFSNCEKNPGHTQFIPIKSFEIQHLPKDYQDEDLCKWIKATADLTVRIDVKMTSPHRPEFHPNTNVPYPFYNMRNKTTLRLGTGDIDVFKFNDGHGVDPTGNEFHENGKQITSHFDESTRTCPCTKCQQSDKPNNVWWEILVATATHVVFDDVEASHTTIRLFYDEQDSPEVSLDKVIASYVDTEEDWCQLVYVTCDSSLGEKLFNIAVNMEHLWEKVLSKYRNKSDAKLNFIVSHPHGCPKQVSIGQVIGTYRISEYNKNYDNTKLTYTTCTCPGSSGAPVYCVGSYNTIFHSGALNSGLNYSVVSLYRK